MPTGGLWEHDLWAEIYSLQDENCKRVIITLYRLILDMRNDDVLASKIATAIKDDRRVILTTGQKLIGIILGLLVAADTISHFIH